MNEENWGVGNATNAKAFDRSRMDDGTEFELITGEHPHSRQDNSHYARFADGRIEGFNGHRVITRVEMRTFNYLKTSGLSGNEVREGGQYKIFIEDVLVYSQFCRDMFRGLNEAARKLEFILDMPVKLWRPETFLGRPIYYRDQPAVIDKFYCDESEGAGHRAVILPAEGTVFSPPAYYHDSDWPEEYDGTCIVTDLTEGDIWWFRKEKKS